MTSLGWAFGGQDPRGGSELLQKWEETGTLNDTFIMAYIHSATSVDWRGAAAWVSGVQDPQLRQNAARDVQRSAHFRGVPQEEIDSFFPPEVD